jgi:hypothetical protein
VREGQAVPIGITKDVDTDDEGNDHVTDRVGFTTHRIPKSGKGVGSSGSEGPSPLPDSEDEHMRVQQDDSCVAPRRDATITFGAF